jgi:hypothetical protein
MASAVVISLEIAFFVISMLGSAVAIYELRRARKILSDVLFKKVITWIIYSSFLLAMLSGIVAINFLISFYPEMESVIETYNFTSILFILIWVTIICNIRIAMYVKEIGKTFGFGETNDKELLVETIFNRK